MTAPDVIARLAGAPALPLQRTAALMAARVDVWFERGARAAPPLMIGRALRSPAAAAEAVGPLAPRDDPSLVAALAFGRVQGRAVAGLPARPVSGPWPQARPAPPPPWRPAGRRPRLDHALAALAAGRPTSVARLEYVLAATPVVPLAFVAIGLRAARLLRRFDPPLYRRRLARRPLSLRALATALFLWLAHSQELIGWETPLPLAELACRSVTQLIRWVERAPLVALVGQLRRMPLDSPALMDEIRLGTYGCGVLVDERWLGADNGLTGLLIAGLLVDTPWAPISLDEVEECLACWEGDEVDPVVEALFEALPAGALPATTDLPALIRALNADAAIAPRLGDAIAYVAGRTGNPFADLAGGLRASEAGGDAPAAGRRPIWDDRPRLRRLRRCQREALALAVAYRELTERVWTRPSLALDLFAHITAAARLHRHSGPAARPSWRAYATA